jgi:hypothetical protein
MAKTLAFHMNAFAAPLPHPKWWNHIDVYPNFSPGAGPSRPIANSPDSHRCGMYRATDSGSRFATGSPAENFCAAFALKSPPRPCLPVIPRLK